MKRASLPAARILDGLTPICRGSVMWVLLFSQPLAAVSRADVADQELKNWFDNSTFVFNGTIVSMNSNVGTVNSSDNPMTVKVGNVLRGNDAASKNVGSLIGKQITVVVDPSFQGGPER